MSTPKRKKKKTQSRFGSLEAGIKVMRQAVFDWDLEHAKRDLVQFLHDDFMINGRYEGQLIFPLLEEADRRFPDAAVPMDELETYVDWLERAVMIHRIRERLQRWDELNRAIHKIVQENEAAKKVGEKLSPEQLESMLGDLIEKVKQVSTPGNGDGKR
jgi:hypothetical protein